MDIGYWCTVAFIVVTSLAIAVYDVYAWKRFGIQDTISLVTRGWNQKHRIVSLALAAGMGVLLGHLFPDTSLADRSVNWVLCIAAFLIGHWIGWRYLP